jgi:hypothetical protein
MHEIINPSQLSVRIAALNLTPTALSHLAGVHHTAVTRLMNGGNSELATLSAISKALLAQELQIQAHLNSLHPATAQPVRGEET